MRLARILQDFLQVGLCLRVCDGIWIDAHLSGSKRHPIG
jgi:hypothetical protein